MEEVDTITTIVDFVNNIPWSTGLGSLAATAVAGTGVFSFLRRAKSTDTSNKHYFTDSKLLSPPMKRPAYSDRMAYVLADMSDLAYYEFEGKGGLVNDAVENALKLKLDNSEDIRQFLDDFCDDLFGSRSISTEFLERLLSKSKFELLTTINVEETQGFVCKRTRPNEPSYVVIAFRGTEKKISDWLTDADAVPTEKGNTKVHTGFLNAFSIKTDQSGKTVEQILDDVIKNKAKDQNGDTLPLFITGHSLGGALALLATRNLVPNTNGACYTFGAPRVANYEYFEDVKTPVYRVVNSSDIVPRVPPGAGMILILKLIQLLTWLTSFVPPVSSIFKKLGSAVDELNGYRHFGDLRYLTDVATGRFQDVHLLRNPPAIDRALWMWKHLAYSLFMPVKSHSMYIYRKKLSQIANARNN